MNLRTGERCTVHPCDDYYKELVIQERRKKGKGGLAAKKAIGGGLLNNSKPLGMAGPAVVQPVQSKPVAVDPLVKMQQEKALKKLEEQKKKEYEDKKN